MEGYCRRGVPGARSVRGARRPRHDEGDRAGGRRLSAQEILLIEAAARAIGHPCAAAAVAAIAPAAAAGALPTPLLRERALQAAILVAMMDGQAALAEIASLEEYARVLHVDER